MRLRTLRKMSAIAVLIVSCNQGGADNRAPGTNYFSQVTPVQSGNQTPTPADPAVQAREDAVERLAIISYKGDLEIKIAEYCGNCHAGANPKGNLDLSSYDSVKGKVSGLVSKIRTGAMPPNANQLPQATRADLNRLADLLDSWQKNPSQLAEDLATFQDLDYEKTVGPLIAETCVKCHSGDAPSANLRLDSLEALDDRLDDAIQALQNGKMPPKMDADQQGQIARILEAWGEKGTP